MFSFEASLTLHTNQFPQQTQFPLHFQRITLRFNPSITPNNEKLQSQLIDEIEKRDECTFQGKINIIFKFPLRDHQ